MTDMDRTKTEDQSDPLAAPQMSLPVSPSRQSPEAAAASRQPPDTAAASRQPPDTAAAGRQVPETAAASRQPPETAAALRQPPEAAASREMPSVDEAIALREQAPELYELWLKIAKEKAATANYV